MDRPNRKSSRVLTFFSLLLLTLVALGGCRSSDDSNNTQFDTNTGQDLNSPQPDTNSGLDVITQNDTNNPQLDTNVANDTTQPTGTTIKSLQSGTESTTCTDSSCMCNYQGGSKACKVAICNLNNNLPLLLKNVVVVSGKFYVSAKKDGYYIADPAGGEYNGVALTVDNTWNVVLEKGKRYDMQVKWGEFFCQTQLELANKTGMVEQGSGTPPQAVPVDASTLINGGADAEKWEGVLVKVTVNSKVASASNNSITLESGLVIRDDFSLWFSGSWNPPAVGTDVIEVIGFVKHPFQSTGSYSLAPASLGDVKLGQQQQETKTIESIQSDTNSTTCMWDGCDDFCDIKSNVKLENVVVVSQLFEVSGSGGLDGFYVSEGAGANKSILIVFDKGVIGTNDFPRGTALSSITGNWSETYCLTDFEVTKKEDIVKGGGVTEPGPTAITYADLTWPKGEEYESTKVELNGSFKVINVDKGKGLVRVNDGTTDFNVSNTFDIWTDGTYPAVDTVFTKIVGMVQFFKGDKDASDLLDKPNYYIRPLSIGDVTK